jgi:Bacterial CdiA-CT RNAse A domain
MTHTYGDYTGLTREQIQNSAYYKKSVKLADQKKQLDAQIQQAHRMQISLEYAYPALSAVKGETGKDPQDMQKVQGRMPGQFNGMRGDIDRLSKALTDDPSKAWLFDSVVATQLKDKSISPQQRQQVVQWIEQEHQKAAGGLMLSGLLSGGLFAASFIPLLQDVAIPLRVLGLLGGEAIAASEIPDVMLLDAAAQAGRGGVGKLTSQSPEQARFNLVMGYANVALAGLDVGLEVGAVQKLAGLTGKLATTGVQVSRQKWSQVMVWAKQGPAGVEKAKALLGSIKGLPRAAMNEILDAVAPLETADGIGRIPRRELKPNQPMQMKGKGKAEDGTLGSRRNTADHEKAGGHSEDRHVGKSESWLRDRLETDPTLKNQNHASSFRNNVALNRTQGRFTKRYKKEISAWLKNDKATGVFKRVIDMEKPIGIVVERNTSGYIETTKALVILAKDNSSLGYHIVTSFPVIK